MGITFDTNASEITLPEGMTHISAADVRNLRNLHTLITPDSLEELDLSLFKWLSLKRLRIGAHTRFKSLSALASLKLEWFDVSPENPYYETDGIALYERTTKELLTAMVPVERYCVREDCPAIGEKAFYGFDMLAGVELPDGLVQIGPLAFASTRLTVFRAPKSLRRICEKAFYLCRNLHTVELNEGLESVGSGAFAATAINELDLPRSIREVGTGVVANMCISIPSDNAYYFVDDHGGVYGKTPDGLILREVTDKHTQRFEVHPETIAVEEKAFRGHAAIEEVVLPEGLREIGDYAFSGCSHLRKVSFPETLQHIGLGAFRGTRLEEAYLPAGLDYLGFEALFTNGDVFRKKTSSLVNVRVHPDNKRFYVQNDMLIELIDAEHTPDPPAWYVREGAAAGEARRPAKHTQETVRNQLENVIDYAYKQTAIHGIGGGRVTYDIPDFLLEFNTPAAEIAPSYFRSEFAKETVRAVTYFGDNGVIDVPENVDAIGANAFSYARNVREMRLHDGIKVIEPGEYMEKIPAHLHVEYSEPYEGRSAVDAYFPQHILGDQPFTRNLLYCTLDPVALMERVDLAISSSSSTYERSYLLLWRLCDPYLLNPELAAVYRARLRSDVDGVCLAFARNGYTSGLARLAEAGVLDASNIKHAIEAVGERGTLEAASYLLEVKRVYFDGGTNADYSL